MEVKKNQHTLADVIRVLSAQAIDQANSGHPGMPMGMADIAQVLWTKYLTHDPAHPNWPNRDRFILSNGHGSMLLYALLHLTGYDLPMEQIKQFRQLHSQTPGHPETHETIGVETTTGPLGQGFANAVGMAISAQLLAAQFNTPTHTLIDYYTYVFVGDGCLMEGISHESASLAGHLGLKKLIVFYDDNQITIDGHTNQTFSENTANRFLAYNWHVIQVAGHHQQHIAYAIDKAKEQTKPTLVICKTIIGFGSPNKQGQASVHGAPLGSKETQAFCEQISWPYPPFEIPESIYKQCDARPKGKKHHDKWQSVWVDYQSKHPKRADEFKRRKNKQLPDQLVSKLSQWTDKKMGEINTPLATRQTSQKIHAFLAVHLPELVGGSADLAGSNLTTNESSRFIESNNWTGNSIYFGVREFGMSAIASGLALSGFFRPYVATFLVFSDYARSAIRMSALMKLNTIYIMTHDSIGLGEDGPTHQPVEHLNSLRLIPNLYVWRPCDFKENAVAWRFAIQSTKSPTLLALSRQKLPQLSTTIDASHIEKGGYILANYGTDIQVMLIATGSEVEIAHQAFEILKKQGISTQLVSMPCCEVFDQQPKDYQAQIIPQSAPCKIAIEAGNKDRWYKYVGIEGEVIGLDSFGASGKAKDLYKHFKITTEHVVSVCTKKLKISSLND